MTLSSKSINPGIGMEYVGAYVVMQTCTRRFVFDAAHRVLGHKGKCQYLHGHRYVVEVTVQTPSLDKLGMVMDFGVVKELVGGFIEKELDHNTILQSNDPLYPILCNYGPVATMEGNPTAENIAALLFRRAGALLKEADPRISVCNVRVWETENCYADYSERKVSP